MSNTVWKIYVNYGEGYGWVPVSWAPIFETKELADTWIYSKDDWECDVEAMEVELDKVDETSPSVVSTNAPMMELEFVDELELRFMANSKYNATLLLFLRALKEHPERWAKFPILVASSVVVQKWKRTFPEFQFKVSGGNNLRKSSPDKKMWTVYVKYTPIRLDLTGYLAPSESRNDA